MRVIAARFSDPQRAWAVLGQLRRDLNVDPPDVEVAPLGIPGQPRENQFVLAGRFPDPLVPRVVNCVRDAGGEVVANIDEAWTGAGSSRRPSQA